MGEVHRGVLADAVEDDECGVGAKHGDGLRQQLLESGELRLECLEELGVFHLVDVIIREGKIVKGAVLRESVCSAIIKSMFAVLEREHRRFD